MPPKPAAQPPPNPQPPRPLPPQYNRPSQIAIIAEINDLHQLNAIPKSALQRLTDTPKQRGKSRQYSLILCFFVIKDGSSKGKIFGRQCPLIHVIFCRIISLPENILCSLFNPANMLLCCAYPSYSFTAGSVSATQRLIRSLPMRRCFQSSTTYIWT